MPPDEFEDIWGILDGDAASPLRHVRRWSDFQTIRALLIPAHVVDPDPVPEEEPMPPIQSPECDYCHTQDAASRPILLRPNGRSACTPCAATNTAACAFCATEIPLRDLAATPTGTPACVRCAARFFVQCADCEALVNAGEAYRVRPHGDRVCEPCYSAAYVGCTCCGYGVQTDDMIPLTTTDTYGWSTSHQLCQICYDTQFAACDGCQQLVERSNLARVRVEGWQGRRLMCVQCCGNRTRCGNCATYYTGARCPCDRPRLMGHAWRPDQLLFMRTATEERQVERHGNLCHLGWELEVELEDYDYEELPTLLERLAAPWLFFKRDGSLSNGGDGGFEMVSHPMTYAWMQENREEIARRLRLLVQSGCRSFDTNTCGLHVHMSKASFTPYEFYRFQKLIYENKSFALRVAQRSGGRVEEYASLNREEPRRMVRKARRMRNNATDHERHRYVAVNVENDHTVELRLFKGTLNVGSFFKAIEFCVAAQQFAREESQRNMTAGHFTDWVAKHVKEYPNLHGFLYKNGLYQYEQDEGGELLPKPFDGKKKSLKAR